MRGERERESERGRNGPTAAAIRALCFLLFEFALLFFPSLLLPPLLSPRRLAPDGSAAVEDPRHAVGDRVFLGHAEDAARRHRVFAGVHEQGAN